MANELTFGETIRRLRREKQWSLTTLATETGLSYSHLSRLENDSVSPGADAVARLAETLDGDLRELLELADCLPEVILNRIARQGSGALNRRAGPGDAPDGNGVGGLVADFALRHGLEAGESYALAEAIERLVSLPPKQRQSIERLILTMDSNRGD